MTLVLASASPRRSQILAQAGFQFTVHPAHIPEDPYPSEDPADYVTRLALQKAQAVFAEISSQTSSGAPDPPLLGIRDTTALGNSGLTVLGADTTVTLDGHILGKPVDPDDAARMLRLLSGRVHKVLTGVALVTPHATRTAYEATAVHFLPLSDARISAYIASEEPMDKAGAYAIQGRAARWIPRIEGCYFNVVGLPIALVASLLAAVPSASGASLESV